MKAHHVIPIAAVKSQVGERDDVCGNVFGDRCDLQRVVAVIAVKRHARGQLMALEVERVVATAGFDDGVLHAGWRDGTAAQAVDAVDEAGERVGEVIGDRARRRGVIDDEGVGATAAKQAHSAVDRQVAVCVMRIDCDRVRIVAAVDGRVLAGRQSENVDRIGQVVRGDLKVFKARGGRQLPNGWGLRRAVVFFVVVCSKIDAERCDRQGAVIHGQGIAGPGAAEQMKCGNRRNSHDVNASRAGITAVESQRFKRRIENQIVLVERVRTIREGGSRDRVTVEEAGVRGVVDIKLVGIKSAEHIDRTKDAT